MPFILTRLSGGGWLFDVSLNWRTMAGPVQRAAWSEHQDATPLTLALLDAKSNQLLAYRRFAPAPAFVAQLRTVARRQLKAFAENGAVAQALRSAELLPLPLMSQRTTYYPAPQ